jgi:tetratricopeptide (TPR) repeat protein
MTALPWIVAAVAILIWMVGYFGGFWHSAVNWEKERELKAISDMGSRTEHGIRDAMRRYPKSVTPARAWVDLSISERNWPEAMKRAEMFAKMFPSRAEPIVCIAEVLSRSDREAESNALLERNMKRFHSGPWILVAYADNPRRRGDAAETERRVKPLIERFPRLINGYIIGIWALTAQQKYAEAEALIAAGDLNVDGGLKQFGQIPAAEIASARKDWRRAADLWMGVRVGSPGHIDAYAKGSEALRELGDLEAARDFIDAGIKRYPDNRLIQREYERIMAAFPSGAAEPVGVGAPQPKEPPSADHLGAGI